MKTKKISSIHSIIIKKLFLLSFLILILAITLISYFMVRFIFYEVGESRLTLLQQINDNNSFYRSTMINSMDIIYNKIYNTLFIQDMNEPDKSEKINSDLKYVKGLLQTSGIYYSIDIIMNDGTRYFTNNDEDYRISLLMRSYWYINHVSGETDTSWNFNYSNDEVPNSNLYISYGKTIYDTNGNPKGVIIISSPNENLSKTYRNVLDSSNTIYIMDENGIIVSHTNKNMIGILKYDMDFFEQTIGFNIFYIKRTFQGYFLITNYHDPASGWTVVEEKRLSSVFNEYLSFFVYSILILSVTLGLIVALGYYTLRKITNPMKDMTLQITNMEEISLSPISIKNHYKEIDVLLNAFNSMIIRIEDLIEKRRIQEEEQTRIEFEYLQAQINPHFLHNTLVTIKSLIALGKTKKAEITLEKFMAILRVPLLHYRQFIYLDEEIELIKNYISIMEYRLDKEIRTEINIPDKFSKIAVPRMILEPIISNAIYHGFAETKKGDLINISAHEQDNDLLITIKDNGEGITPERLKLIRSGEVKAKINSHGIGLQNTRDRIKLIYGDESNIMITSSFEKGTSVTLLLKNYKNLSERVFNN